MDGSSRLLDESNADSEWIASDHSPSAREAVGVSDSTSDEATSTCTFNAREETSVSTPSDLTTQPDGERVLPISESVLPVLESAASTPVDAASHEYRVKWVETQGAPQPLITQSINGPCPLLALVNAMLLRGKLQFPAELASVAGHRLLEFVGNLLVDGAAAGSLSVADTQRADLERNVQDALAVLPKLLTGLDVNVRFTGVSEFEYTPELVIFDLLNVALYHGWLLDPTDRWRCDAVGTCSYNRLVELIVANKHSENSELLNQALVAEEFLEESASQITDYGLLQLQQQVSEGEVAVLFRNNHFSTIYKYQGVLYALVTDQGFLSEPDIVWETLVPPRMDTRFVNGEFAPLPGMILDEEQACSPVSPQRTDLDIALELQSQEYALDAASEVVTSSTSLEPPGPRHEPQEPLRPRHEPQEPLRPRHEPSRPRHQTHTSPSRTNKNNMCSVM